MKAIKILVLMLLTLAFAGIAHAATVPVTIDSVQVNDQTLTANADNPFSVERGDEITVTVVMTANADVKDVSLKADIDGFEYGDIYDSIGPMDLKSGVTYQKELTLTVSDEVTSEYYKLRVRVVNKNDNTLQKEYNLLVDMPRHAIAINDVVMTPESKIKSGSALLVSVRLENKGYKDEEDIKVRVSIPDLGLSASEYLDAVDTPDEEEGTEEIYLKIPRCAKPGIYDVIVEAIYNEGANKVLANKLIEVLADDTCEAANTSSQPQTTITVGSKLEKLEQGAQAIFPITITNSGKTSKAFTLAVTTPDWASTKITPTGTILLDAGKTETMYLFVSAKDKAPAGAQVITATITSGNEVQQIPLTLDVAAAKSSGVKTFLQVVLIVLVVLLVIIALVVGFTKLRGNDEEKPVEKYY